MSAEVREGVSTSEVKELIGLLRSTVGGDSSLTLGEAWKMYESANGGRVRSIGDCAARARRMTEFFGSRAASTLTLEDVDTYRQWLRELVSERKQQPISVASRNRHVEIVVRVLNFAVSRKLLRRNPLAGIEYEPEDNVRRVVIDPPLLDRILAALDPFMRAFVLVAIDSGMRAREVLTLRWDHVDEERGLIEIEASETKTGHARTTVISGRARRALGALPRQPVFVFGSARSGEPYDQTYLYYRFQNSLTEAGIKAPDGRKIWLHDLRRAFVVNARRSGVPETVVRQLTGLRTSMVFERYNIKGLEDVLAARKTLENAHRRLARRRGQRFGYPNGKGAA